MRPSPFGIRALALGILIALLPAFGLRQAWPMVPLLLKLARAWQRQLWEPTRWQSVWWRWQPRRLP